MNLRTSGNNRRAGFALEMLGIKRRRTKAEAQAAKVDAECSKLQKQKEKENQEETRQKNLQVIGNLEITMRKAAKKAAAPPSHCVPRNGELLLHFQFFSDP